MIIALPNDNGPAANDKEVMITTIIVSLHLGIQYDCFIKVRVIYTMANKAVHCVL